MIAKDLRSSLFVVSICDDEKKFCSIEDWSLNKFGKTAWNFIRFNLNLKKRS